MKRFVLISTICIAGTAFVGCDDQEMQCLAGCDNPWLEYSSGHDSINTKDETTNTEKDDPVKEEIKNPEALDKDKLEDIDKSDEIYNCNNACLEDEICLNGECLKQCPEGKMLCGTICINLDMLGLKNCTTCKDDYCDIDNNILTGCEAYTKGADSNNCGACGNKCNSDQACVDGTCTNICPDGQQLCGDSCLDLNALHMEDCETCSKDYCNLDGSFSNGCELSVKGSDVNNCGACGKKCGNNQTCESGVCTDVPVVEEKGTRYIILVGSDTLNVRKGPGTGNEILGELKSYTYVTVYESKDGWLRIKYKDQPGWISGSYAMDAGDQYPGRKAIDLAETFLWSSSTKLCTYDHITHAPILKNFTNLDIYGSTYNYGYNDNCANFVTSSLKTSGLIAKNFIAVSQIKSYCNAGTEGYHQVSSFSKAKPGDIWINSSGGHTELVMGYHNGSLILIGSNNFSSGDSDTNCQKRTGQRASAYQRVSYSSSSTGYLCSRQ